MSEDATTKNAAVQTLGAQTDSPAQTNSLSEPGAAPTIEGSQKEDSQPEEEETEEDADEPPAAQGEPYEYSHCTITVSIQLLPDDGDPRGRPVIVGVRNHQDPPIVRFVRAEDLAPMSPILGNMLAQLATEMPTRRQAKEAREAKARAEEEESAAKRKKVEDERRAKQAERAAKKAKATATSPAATSLPAAQAPATPSPKSEPKAPGPQQISLF